MEVVCQGITVLTDLVECGTCLCVIISHNLCESSHVVVHVLVVEGSLLVVALGKVDGTLHAVDVCRRTSLCHISLCVLQLAFAERNECEV